MDDEDDFRRPPPPCAYTPTGGVLSVSADVVGVTLAILQRVPRRECGLFWYGPRDAKGNGQVAYVIAPRQIQNPRNYHIPAEAMGEIVHRLADDWKPLAMVHSHPGLFVEHSRYDDRMTSSRKALSLVFPLYGRDTAEFPAGVGIHEYQNDYWHLLDPKAVSRRIAITTGQIRVEDLR